MIVEIGNVIYLFEFKIVGAAQNAIAQIEEKFYYQQYLDTQKDIILVGIVFGWKVKNIDVAM